MVATRGFRLETPIGRRLAGHAAPSESLSKAGKAGPGANDEDIKPAVGRPKTGDSEPFTSASRRYVRRNTASCP